jgi:hypothetical protein
MIRRPIRRVVCSVLRNLQKTPEFVGRMASGVGLVVHSFGNGLMHVCLVVPSVLDDTPNYG